MNSSDDGYPIFEVDENNLLNFEEFCEERYHDPLVQKLGFFKVQLQKDVERQTSIHDFLENFSADAYAAVKETIILENPVDCGLYGHHNLHVPPAFRDDFMEKATPDAFEIKDGKLNCWIVIPPYAVSHLTDALTKCGFGGIHKTCRNVLGHKFFIPSVTWLLSEGIPFNVVIQKEGEGMVLLPNAAHSGGNLGHNVAQACNFGTKPWIPYGCVYPLCPCMEDSVHADLTPIVAVHYKDLLKAYITNNVLSAAKDDYFSKSVVLSRGAPCQDCTPVRLQPCTSKDNRLRLKCPICPYNWGPTIPRVNVMHHLTKYHPHHLETDRVVNFLKEQFPSAKS